MTFEGHNGHDEFYGLESKIWFGFDPDSDMYWGWCEYSQDWVQWLGEEWSLEEPEVHVASKTKATDIEVSLEGEGDMDDQEVDKEVDTERDDEQEDVEREDEQEDDVVEDEKIVEEEEEVFPEPTDLNVEDPWFPKTYFNVDKMNYYWLGHEVTFNAEEQYYYVIEEGQEFKLGTDVAATIGEAAVILSVEKRTKGVAALASAKTAAEEKTDASTPPASGQKVEKTLQPTLPTPTKKGKHSLFLTDGDLLSFGVGRWIDGGVDSNALARLHRKTNWGDLAIGKGFKAIVENLVLNVTSVETQMHRLGDITHGLKHWNIGQLLLMAQHLTKTDWRQAAGNQLALYEFGMKTQTELSINITAQAVLNLMDPENGPSALFVPKYPTKVRKADRDTSIEATQMFLKSMSQDHQKCVGTQILLIEGMISKLGGALEDKTWKLDAKKSITQDSIQGSHDDDSLYYRKFQMSNNANDLGVKPEDCFTLFMGEGVAQSGGFLTNWHADSVR